MSAQPPGDTADQAARGAARARSGLREQERPRAVRALGAAGLGDALREEGRLLVDEEPGQRDAVAEGGGDADGSVRVHDLRHPFAVQAEDAERLRRPGDLVEVEELGTAGGRRIGDEGAREPVDQPGVAGGDDAVPGAFTAYPRHFGRGEVGVEGQAGQPGQFIGVRGEFLAQRLRPPVLPDDGVGERIAPHGIPGQHRLALVGEPDRVDRFPGVGEGLAARVDHGCQQAHRVDLDAATRAVAGFHRRRSGADHSAFGADDQRFRAGSALVDGKHRAGHRPPRPSLEGNLDRGRKKPGSGHVGRQVTIETVHGPILHQLLVVIEQLSKIGGTTGRGATTPFRSQPPLSQEDP